MHSQNNEEFGEDKHKNKHVSALSWDLLSAVFQFSDDHRHVWCSIRPSFVIVNKYVSDVVEMRHPAILQTWPTAYRGVQITMATDGDLVFLFVTHTAFVKEVKTANGVHKNIQ
jgi:hypothetical protein